MHDAWYLFRSTAGLKTCLASNMRNVLELRSNISIVGSEWAVLILRTGCDKVLSMVFILDGSSEHGAHIWNT